MCVYIGLLVINYNLRGTKCFVVFCFYNNVMLTKF